MTQEQCKLPEGLEPSTVALGALQLGYEGEVDFPTDEDVMCCRAGMIAALKAVKDDIEERYYGGAEVEQTAFVDYCISVLEKQHD